MTLLLPNKKKLVKLVLLVFSFFYVLSFSIDALHEHPSGAPALALNIAVTAVVIVLFAGETYALFRRERSMERREATFSQFFWNGWAFIGVMALTSFMSSPLLLPLFYLLSAVAFAFFPLSVAVFYFVLTIGIQYVLMCFVPWTREWQNFGVFSLSSVLFSMLGYFLRHERKKKQDFESRLQDIEEGVKTFFDGDEEPVLALNEEKRIESLQNTFTFFEDRVLKTLQQIKDLMDPYTVAFLKIKDDGKYYRVFEAISDNDFIRHNEDIPIEDGIVGWIYKYGKSLGMGTFKGGYKSLNYYDREVGVNSFLGMPVMWKERIVGVLLVDSLQEEAFSEESENIVRMSASQIEEALENSLLIQQMQQESKEFGALYDASRSMLSFVGLTANLNGFLDLVQTFMPFEAAAVCLLEDDVLRVKAARGFRDDILDTDVQEDSLNYWVVNHRQDLDLKRYDEKKRRSPLISAKIREPHFTRVTIFPLMIEDRVLGSFILGFRDREPAVYEKSILEILINQTCVAVSNALLFEKVNMMATTDGLTGINNHRLFQEKFTEVIERARRYEETFALILMDIDFFKKVNDTYGHPVGDIVLKRVAHILRTSVRKVDTVARYGGEEFAIIMVQSTADGASGFAERLRREIEKTEILFDGGKLNVTVSMGVAAYPADGTEKPAIIERADKALYRAKAEGRNRVIVSGKTEED